SGGIASGTVIGKVLGVEDVLSGGDTVDTTIAGGTLILDAGSIVDGSVTFDPSARGRMYVGGVPTQPFPAPISGFLPGDRIDFSQIAFDPNYSIQLLEPGNLLVWYEFGSGHSLRLDPSQNFTGKYFHVSDDGGGGTTMTLVAPF